MPLRLVLRATLAASLLAGLLGAVPAAAADDPSAPPSPAPSAEPSPSPDPTPAADPTPEPTPGPTAEPTGAPSAPATAEPSADPSASPSATPDPNASPSPDPGATTPPTPGWTGRFNLYRSTAWVRQYRDYTCTAASAQTMLNLIKGRSDRSLLLQLRIIKYAKSHDYLRYSAGSDPAGWARALTAFGAGTYTWRTFSTKPAALRYAAVRMRITNKPVGLLVWRGRHAWTMTGFKSATDPLTDPVAAIAGVFVAPPLVGVDPRPNTYITTASLGTFARYQERDGLRTWVGRWVVVAP